MMTIMMPDLLEPTEEIRELCAFVVRDLHELPSLLFVELSLLKWGSAQQVGDAPNLVHDIGRRVIGQAVQFELEGHRSQGGSWICDAGYYESRHAKTTKSTDGKVKGAAIGRGHVGGRIDFFRLPRMRT